MKDPSQLHVPQNNMRDGSLIRHPSAGATWHDYFARCPECGNATVGLAPPFAINHAIGCSMPEDKIERALRNAEQDREVSRLLTDYDRIVARLTALGVDVKARDRANG